MTDENEYMIPLYLEEIPDMRQKFDSKLLSNLMIGSQETFASEKCAPPINNIIDIENLDLCETCKSRFISEFIKVCRARNE